jgi:uncharacterized membrane protein YeaQ/YmgE (transglycosylase-associated protein family)
MKIDKCTLKTAFKKTGEDMKVVFGIIIMLAIAGAIALALTYPIILFLGTTTKAAQIIASIVGSLVCIYIMLFLIRYTVEKDIF